MQPGASFRSAGPEEVEAAAGIMAAEEAALRGETQWSPETLREWWTLVDPGNAFLAEVGGRAAAVGILLARDGLHDGWGSVAPEFQGRGLGGAVVERLEHRARELGAESLHQVVYADNAAGRRLLEAGGYREVRRYYRMEIALDGPLAAPRWPAGLSPASFAREDARAFHDALTDAFADEWRFAPTSFDEWKERRLEAPDADTSLWFLARDGDEVAAVIRCERREEDVAFVGALGVRERWRRRGLGLALLQHAFAEFARRGARRALLGVDAENPTGATRLYERVGMRVKDVNVFYEKELG